MNLRPSGYEPDELPDCSIPRLEPCAVRRGEGWLREDGATGKENFGFVFGVGTRCLVCPTLPQRVRCYGLIIRRPLAAAHAGGEVGRPRPSDPTVSETLPAEFLAEGEVEGLAFEAEDAEGAGGFFHYDAVAWFDADAVAAIDGEKHRSVEMIER